MDPADLPPTPADTTEPIANGSPLVQRTLLHRGRKFNFELCTVPSANGRLHREVVRHPGAVVILPILDTSSGPQILLIRNWRIAIESWCLELPAGTLEPPEQPQACAARELIEETGYQAATLRPLGRFHTSPGLSDEYMHAFVATGLTSVGQDLEDDERIQVVPTSVAQCFELIDRGTLMDAKSMLTLLLAQRQGIVDPGF